MPSAPVLVFETPLSMRANAAAIRDLFAQHFGDVLDVQVDPTKRAAEIVFSQMSSARRCLEKIVQHEVFEDAFVDVPNHASTPLVAAAANNTETDANEAPSSDVEAQVVKVGVHRRRGYAYLGYYRVMLEGSYRDDDQDACDTGTTMLACGDDAVAENAGDDELNPDGMDRKRLRSETTGDVISFDRNGGEATAVKPILPEILVLTFVPQIVPHGLAGRGPHQQPQPLSLTPFIVYQILRGFVFCKRIILVQSKDNFKDNTKRNPNEVTVNVTQRALIQADSMDTAKEIKSALHQTYVELVDGQGIQARYLVYVKETWEEQDRPRQHYLNTSLNTATALCVIPSAVSHLGAVFDRTLHTPATALQQLQDVQQQQYSANESTRFNIAPPAMHASAYSGNSGHADTSQSSAQAVGFSGITVGYHQPYRGTEPQGHSTSHANVYAGQHENDCVDRRNETNDRGSRHRYRHHDDNEPIYVMSPAAAASSQHPGHPYADLHSGSHREASTAEAVASSSSSHRRDESKRSKHRLPPNYSTAFSEEYQREYYVYTCPNTSVMTTTWTLPSPSR